MADTNRKTILSVTTDAFLPYEFIAGIKEGVKLSGTRTIYVVNTEKILFVDKHLPRFKRQKNIPFFIIRMLWGALLHRIKK